MKKNFADMGGALFYYETAGEGASIVLVHAGIADSRMWDGQFHVLAERFHVVRYDRRGFGQTAMTAGPYSHHGDLHALLKFLHIERATLIGCSQGAKTVTDFTLEYPDMTDALVLVAPALGGFEFSSEPTALLEELERADAAGDIARVNELELRIWVDGESRTPEEVDRRVRERVREMNLIALSTPTGLGVEEPLEPAAATRLDEIRVPTLIVVGDLDTPKTLAASHVLAEKISGAQRVVINGTAHLPNMERPELFNQHVLNFLSSPRRALKGHG